VDETPEREASAKVAQHLAAAVQVAEAIFRLRQQAADRQIAADRAGAGAARAERQAQHAADRIQWAAALDHDWATDASLTDLGRAWGAAAAWSDTDPAANAAATRVEVRLDDLAPHTMARYRERRQAGWTRHDAMRDLLPDLATEDQVRRACKRVFVAEPASTTDTVGYTHALMNDLLGDIPTVANDPGDWPTRRGDEPRGPAGLGETSRAQAATWQSTAETAATLSVDKRGRRVTPSGLIRAEDLARETYPRRFTYVRPEAPTSITPPQRRGTTGRVRFRIR
jgi:hypothetical protein